MPDSKEEVPLWELRLHRFRTGRLSSQPYIYQPSAPEGHFHVAHLDEAVASCGEELERRGRLLAAAPAMLRVLLEIREDLLCGGECRHIPSGVQGSILAAISHALGEPADRTHLVEAVKKHAIANYETDGWDFLVECWEDKDILECITGATTEEQAIQACLDTVKLMDERRREVQSDAF